MVPVKLRQSGGGFGGFGTLVKRVAAVSATFLIFTAVGCGLRKTKPSLGDPVAESFQKGYEEGITAGRSSYIDTYGDMIRACVSKNAVETMYKTSQATKAENKRIKKQLKGGVKFAKSCLAEQGKLQKALKGCEQRACMTAEETKDLGMWDK